MRKATQYVCALLTRLSVARTCPSAWRGCPARHHVPAAADPSAAGRLCWACERESPLGTTELPESAAAASVQGANKSHGLQFNTTDPQTGVALGMAQCRNVRSKRRCSMCPAIHINSRSWLRSSSTHEPSDPPLRVSLSLLSVDGAAATCGARLGRLRAPQCEEPSAGRQTRQ